MLLTKKDKEWLKEQIKEAVTEALTVKITMEKRRDIKTGQPLAKPELFDEEVFLPSIFVQMLPFYEGAMRGLQTDVEKSINRMSKMHDKVDTIGKLVVQNANTIKGLAGVVVQQLEHRDEPKQIEFIEGEVKETDD